MLLLDVYIYIVGGSVDVGFVGSIAAVALVRIFAVVVVCGSDHDDDNGIAVATVFCHCCYSICSNIRGSDVLRRTFVPNNRQRHCNFKQRDFIWR